MAMQLRACYDIGDGATLSLRFCVILYNKKEVSLVLYSFECQTSKKMDRSRYASAGHYESQTSRGGGPNDSGFGHG